MEKAYFRCIDCKLLVRLESLKQPHVRCAECERKHKRAIA